MNRQTKIECPKCGSYQVWVTDTRFGNLTEHSTHRHLKLLKVETYTRRRRRCTDCGHGWSTAEFPVDDLKPACDEIEQLRQLKELVRKQRGIRWG